MTSTMKFINKMFKEYGGGCIELTGKCQSCQEPVSLVIFKTGMEVEGNGGMVVGPAFEAKPEFKCSVCLERDKGMISPTRCEVFSRGCGYLRPVSQYNPGKKAEHKMRKDFKLG